MIQHHGEAKTVHLKHCSFNEQIAYILSKAVGREKIENFINIYGLTNTPLDEGGDIGNLIQMDYGFM